MGSQVLRQIVPANTQYLRHIPPKYRLCSFRTLHRYSPANGLLVSFSRLLVQSFVICVHNCWKAFFFRKATLLDCEEYVQISLRILWSLDLTPSPDSNSNTSYCMDKIYRKFFSLKYTCIPLLGKTHGTRFAITLASILKFGPRFKVVTPPNFRGNPLILDYYKLF